MIAADRVALATLGAVAQAIGEIRGGTGLLALVESQEQGSGCL